jgi:hypothetical protein
MDLKEVKNKLRKIKNNNGSLLIDQHKTPFETFRYIAKLLRLGILKYWFNDSGNGLFIVIFNN